MSDYEIPPLTLKNVFCYHIFRWVIASIVFVTLGIAIDNFIMSYLAPSSSIINPTDGGVISPSIISYVILGIGCMIACGINIWTLVLTIILAVYASIHPGYGTFSYQLIQSGYFPIAIALLTILASVEVLRDYYARKDPYKTSRKLTFPALATYIIIIISGTVLNSHLLYDLIF